MKNISYRLYLVTDVALCLHHSLMDVVQRAIQSGVTCVQLREKQLPTGAFVEKARVLKSLLNQYAPHVLMIINDRVDVALAAQADGVHVGQSDMRVADVRALMPPNAIVGLSIESIDDVQTMIREQLQVDYLGISPVFSTPTKTDTAPPLGLEGIRTIRAMTDLPLVGIGGINISNAREVMQTGADGIAVVSAICSAKNIELAVQELSQAIDSIKKIEVNK